MHQIETVPIPILDRNDQVQSNTQLKISKPYIVLNTETYITLWPWELSTCKKIGYKYYCEELFVVKSKSRYSCTSVIYFDFGPEIIKENCVFDFYFNKTDVKPTVLDGRHQIILPNWPSYKKIMCSYNNNIPISIPSHLYVPLNRSEILCNCNIETESNFPLELLAACGNSETDLVMYFTLNLAFVNYFNKMIESLGIPILRNWTTQEQILPISVESFEINASLLNVPKHWKILCISLDTKSKYENYKNI